MHLSTFSSDRGWARVLRGFLACGIAGLVYWALSVRTVQWAEQSCSDETFMLMTEHLHRLKRSEPVDILFVGDSSLRSSLDPLQFFHETDWTALNLGAVMNGGLLTDRYLLEIYLDSHPPPRAVVLVHSPFAFGLEPDRRLYNAFLARPSNVLEQFRRDECRFEECLDSLFSSLSGLYRYKAYIERPLQSVWLGQSEARLHKTNRVRAFRVARRTMGFFPDPGPPPSMSARYDQTPLLPNATNRLQLQRIQELGRQHAFRILFAYGPMEATLSRRISQSKMLRELSSYLTKEPSSVELLTPSVPAFPVTDLAGSIVHTSTTGARQYTSMTAEWVRRALSPREM